MTCDVSWRMRYLDYPGQGRPAGLTESLEELLVLTLGAIESVNVERWALSFGALDGPILPGKLRTAAYETDVVGAVHRLGQRYWERRGEAAMWERPFPTGKKGRPPAVDIALFSATAERETRVEFGEYSRSKLREDASKLSELVGQTHDVYPNVESYVVLWSESEARMTKERRRSLVREYSAAAGKIAHPKVELLSVTGADLFTAARGHHRWFAIALFRIS